MTFRTTEKGRAQSKLVKENDIKDVVKSLARGNSMTSISKKLMKSKLSSSIQKSILKLIENSCKLIGKNSVLLDCSSAHLENFKFQALNIQVQTCAPFLYDVINCLSKQNETVNAVIISLVLRARNIQMSRLHHIITQVLDPGGATDEVNCFKPPKQLIVSQAFPNLFQMPLICLFSDLNKKNMASLSLFRCQNQNINIFML